jgi:hypothetical protein
MTVIIITYEYIYFSFIIKMLCKTQVRKNHPTNIAQKLRNSCAQPYKMQSNILYPHIYTNTTIKQNLLIIFLDRTH